MSPLLGLLNNGRQPAAARMDAVHFNYPAPGRPAQPAAASPHSGQAFLGSTLVLGDVWRLGVWLGWWPAQYPEHFGPPCARRMGTPPRPRKCAAFPPSPKPLHRVARRTARSQEKTEFLGLEPHLMAFSCGCGVTAAGKVPRITRIARMRRRKRSSSASIIRDLRVIRGPLRGKTRQALKKIAAVSIVTIQPVGKQVSPFMRKWLWKTTRDFRLPARWASARRPEIFRLAQANCRFFYVPFCES